MTSVTTTLSGPVAAPPPLPNRPPRRDGEMPWDEAVDRHRHRLAAERAARPKPWDTATIAAAVDDATGRLLALQGDVLDLLDAGGLADETLVRGLARLLRGCELERGLHQPLEWIAEAAPPRLLAPPTLVDERALRRRWQEAQAFTAKPVKLALLGPVSFAMAIEDAVHGRDVDASAHAIAEALNPGLRSLAEAGCPAIELIEPALMTATPRVTARGLEAVARVFHRVPTSARRWLRLVPADAVDPWLGMPPPALRLGAIDIDLEDLPVDTVVLEPPTVLTDIAVIDRWRRLAIALLVVPAEADASFRADDRVDALLTIGARLEPGRLVVAVDGGGARARLPLRHRLGLLQEIVRAAA